MKQKLARLRIAQLKEEQRLSREPKDLEAKRQKELKDRRKTGNVKGETRTRTSDGRKPITVEQPCSSQQKFTIPSSKYFEYNGPSRRVDDTMVQVRDKFEHVCTLEGRVPSTPGPERSLPASGDEETEPKQLAGNDNSLQPNYTLQGVDLPRHEASPLPTPRPRKV